MYMKFTRDQSAIDEGDDCDDGSLRKLRIVISFEVSWVRFLHSI